MDKKVLLAIKVKASDIVKKTTVVHCKKEKYDIYIGRPSKWGNPFSLEKYGREESILRYTEYVLKNRELMSSLHELRGKVLGCWCKPLPCHGDVLAALADIYG